MYYYQTMSKQYLDRILTIPDDFHIRPEYAMYGLEKPDFITALKSYRGIVAGIYRDILQNPEAYDLPKYEQPNNAKEWEELSVSVKSPIFILYAIGTSSHYDNGRLVVENSLFRQITAKIKAAYINLATNILKKHGFIFENGILGKDNGITVSFPCNSSVLIAIKAMSDTLPLWVLPSSGLVNEYRTTCYFVFDIILFSYVKSEQMPFSVEGICHYVTPEDSTFIRTFNSNMQKRGYMVGINNEVFSPGVVIRYDYVRSDPRATIHLPQIGGRCALGLRMQALGPISDYIDTCSGLFKSAITRLWGDCTHCMPDACVFRTHYAYDGKQQEKCTYENWGYIWARQIFTPLRMEDLESYIYMLDYYDTVGKKASKKRKSQNEASSHPFYLVGAWGDVSKKLDPLDERSYTFEAFKPHFNQNVSVMKLITTASSVVAINAEVADEALFRAKIHPKTKASALSQDEIRKLYNEIPLTIKTIIADNGTIYYLPAEQRKHRSPVGQDNLGKPCRNCSTPINRISILTRWFYFCPHCQQEKGSHSE